ncbi:MAG: hypothetical protein GY733_18385, partial [bacterium]|nr:hypothetical protein [bacterium]
MSSLRTIDTNVPQGAAELGELLETLQGGGLLAADAATQLDVPGIVAGILEEVRSGGDEAAA